MFAVPDLFFLLPVSQQIIATVLADAL